MFINMTPSDYIQFGTLIIVTVYTFVTYRLLAAQSRQGFENKFFQLLNLHHTIVNSIYLPAQTILAAKKGRDCFEALYEKFADELRREYAQGGYGELSVLLNNSYVTFYSRYQSDLGHYFRNLYHIIKFVDQSDVSDKSFYISLIRAQLSIYELTLLFYNCLSDLGKEKAKPLVERYCMFKNMPQTVLVDLQAGSMKIEYQIKLFKSSAFTK